MSATLFCSLSSLLSSFSASASAQQTGNASGVFTQQQSRKLSINMSSLHVRIDTNEAVVVRGLCPWSLPSDRSLARVLHGGLNTSEASVFVGPL